MPLEGRQEKRGNVGSRTLLFRGAPNSSLVGLIT
jgi:hypothetical protein